MIRSITEAERTRPFERPVRRSSSTRRPARSESTPTLTFTTPALWRPVALTPTSSDADFQAKKGVRGAEDLINLVLNPGQYTDLLLAVQEINGFTDDERVEGRSKKPITGGGMRRTPTANRCTPITPSTG